MIWLSKQSGECVVSVSLYFLKGYKKMDDHEKNLSTESSLLPALACWRPLRSQNICSASWPQTRLARSRPFLWGWLLEWWSYFLYILCEGSRWHLCTSSFWSESQMAFPVNHEETLDTQLLTSRSRTSFPLLELGLQGIKACNHFCIGRLRNVWGTLEQEVIRIIRFQRSWSRAKF